MTETKEERECLKEVLQTWYTYFQMTLPTRIRHMLYVCMYVYLFIILYIGYIKLFFTFNNLQDDEAGVSRMVVFIPASVSRQKMLRHTIIFQAGKKKKKCFAKIIYWTHPVEALYQASSKASIQGYMGYKSVKLPMCQRVYSTAAFLNIFRLSESFCKCVLSANIVSRSRSFISSLQRQKGREAFEYI